MAILRLYNLTLGLDDDARALRRAAAARLELPDSVLKSVSLVKRGVDARERVPVYNCTADVEVTGDVEDILKRLGDNARVAPTTPPLTVDKTGARESRGRVIVVGSGPAGAFAAYVLALNGHKPLLVERGPAALERLQQIGRFNARVKDHDPESNALFGEGGAGSFSDGKLWTSNRDPFIPRVLEVFVDCGAPSRILTDASPHVGTDILARVVVKMRERIEKMGGEIRFKTRLDDVEIAAGVLAAAQIAGEKVETSALVLAPGHSARDTYAMLHRRGVALAAKPFQLGVRIEHPQEFIDKAQLNGKYARDKRLTPASYDLSCQLAGAPELYSFCMCPGGVTIAAISEPGMLCINGMSYSVRASGYANSALVTTFAPGEYGDGSALSGIEFQRRYEEAAFDAGGGDYTVPAQPVTHLLRGIVSPRPLKGSYTRGRKYTRLDTLLPEKLLIALRAGLPEFDRRIKGYIQDSAILQAVESRASGPVRITRDETTRESVNVAGLYPCGEGAGYAGGIVSAACDGIKSALAICSQYSTTRG
ncbi:MAG: NAD(P)/FAD-dependent oxidoreductase [Planctomycetes bacterium]|nr:NAD(P)/FAD-dependent oxidoreductase [Planctomycetota bacterium]